MNAPLQTRLVVLFDGTDITEEVGSDLLSFSYSDKETDEADTVTFTLMDPEGKWAGSWRPDGGEKVEATIYDGTVHGVTGILDCGKFTVDSLRCSGSPRVMEISATSIPLASPIRRKKKTRAWEKTTLKAIAGAIAGENGLELLWDMEENPEYPDQAKQDKASDLEFLLGLCRDAGASVKVTDGKLAVFDQKSYEKKEPVGTIVLGTSRVISWEFSTQKAETYKSVKVSWRSPKQKSKVTAASYYNRDFEKVTVKPKKSGGNPAVNEFVYTDPDAPEDGQEFELKKKCASRAEAERLAKAKLRELNARSVTGSITIVGDTMFVAGAVIGVSGFGTWDGNFIIEAAKHSIGSGGYATALQLRRVNGRY